MQKTLNKMELILKEGLEKIESNNIDEEYVNIIKTFFDDIEQKITKNNINKYLEILKIKISEINKKINLNLEKLEVIRCNKKFELNRRLFYKQIFSKNNNENINKELINNIQRIWSSKYEKKSENNKQKWKIFMDNKINNNFEENETINYEEFQQNIKYLRNWSATGEDKIYNFYIKYLTSIHQKIIFLFNEMINDNSKINNEFNKSKIILIPKKINPSEEDFRPISLLNNLFKLCTKIINKRLVKNLKQTNFISNNQGAFCDPTIGSKELLMLDEILMKKINNLKTCWLDVTKAFDNIDHDYLLAVLRKIKIPSYITNIVSKIYNSIYASINIFQKNKFINITNIKIQKGILQGDSLSRPFL